jgi:hypothetical protein
MRKEGKTYSEILAEVPVAKSTLSLWLRSVGLSKSQKQKITKKRLDAARRGAFARRQGREKLVALHTAQGAEDVGKLSERELWLVGVALYWGEGSKQRGSDVSAGIMLGNSDGDMLRVFLKWLKMLKVSSSDIYFELYVHETRKKDKELFRLWWSKKLQVDVGRISKVYFKKGAVLTNRRNVGDLYRGLLRIRVRRSTDLNRRVHGWIHGLSVAD